MNAWEKPPWAPALGALITGKAVEVYSPDVDTGNYERLKKALLRYDLTEDVHRLRFRQCKPEPGESPAQFIFRLQDYLNKWMALDHASRSAKDVQDKFVKEQFLNCCQKDLGLICGKRNQRI